MKTLFIVKNLLRRIELIDEIVFRKIAEKQLLTERLKKFLVEVKYEKTNH